MNELNLENIMLKRKTPKTSLSHDSMNRPEQGTPQRHEVDQGCLGLG